MFNEHTNSQQVYREITHSLLVLAVFLLSCIIRYSVAAMNRKGVKITAKGGIRTTIIMTVPIIAIQPATTMTAW